eukprot:Transcript_1522.p1 GENE.Transcript_1522~~Transcript_1522.p1  ORF type:complete len:522 (-),score=145.21 Transcript_1522:676-2241(-)
MSGQWKVKLGGSFIPYEESSVHEALEAALAGGQDSTEVVVRGTTYTVELKATPMRQVQKADPTKWREVRREAPSSPGGAGPSSSAAESGVGDDAGTRGAKRQRTEEALAWRLNTLDPRWRPSAAAQAGTVGLAELLSPSELRGATELHLHNFMIDLDWMCEECPGLAGFAGRIRVFHGDGAPPRSAAARSLHVECLAPPTEQFGTHHSKAILVVRPERLSVHVVTGNFIWPDWKNKTNAIASFHFPRLAGAAPAAPAAGFGADLLEYYAAVKAIGSSPPPAFRVPTARHQPARAPTVEERDAFAALPLAFLAAYDYSGARARLVASVPGTSPGVAAGRHAGAALHRWGHMRLRHELRAEGLAARFEDASLLLQFSSLSSVGTDTRWLLELMQSLCGGDAAMPRLRAPVPSVEPNSRGTRSSGCSCARSPPRWGAGVLFPTRDQVKDSYEGWIAGMSIPCNEENADRLRARLRELSGMSGMAALCGWDGGRADGAAGCAGRASAVPHIKTCMPIWESNHGLQ